MRFAMMVVGAASAAALGQVNVLENPGFESGVLDPWFQLLDFGGPQDWHVTDDDANSGGFSAMNEGNKLIVQEFDPIPTEDIQELAVWIRSPEAEINAFFFQYSDGSEEQAIIIHATDAWTQYSALGELDPGKELVTFGLWGYLGGGPDPDITFLDDARLIIEGGGCAADLDGDDDADADDFFAYLDAFAAGNLDVCDIDGDGDCDADDFFGYLDLFAQGC